MNIILENTGLTLALKAVSRIAPPSNGNINIKCDGNNLKIVSYSEASYCEYVVPCEAVSGQAEFGIPIDAFRSAVQGRKKLSLTYKDTTLQIKSGNFAINLATVDAMDFDSSKQDAEEKEETVQKWVLNTEQATWLKQAVSACMLEPTSINPNPALTISLNPKRAFVCCYGDDHLSFAVSKQIKGDMEVTVPAVTIASILEVFSKQTFKIVHTSTKLEVSNKLCKVAMSLPAAEYMDTEILINKAQEVNKAKGKYITINKQTILDFLTNASALDTKEKERGGISFIGDSSKLVMQIKAIAGQCKAVVKMNADNISFTLDKLYFREAVSRGGEDITIKWIDENGGMVYIPGKSSYFLIATWQNT